MLLDSENTGNDGCIWLGTDDGVLWQTGICWIWKICGVHGIWKWIHKKCQVIWLKLVWRSI